MTNTQIQNNSASGQTHSEQITIAAGQSYELEITGDAVSGFKFIQGLTAHVNSDIDVSFWFAWGRTDYRYIGDIKSLVAATSESEGVIQYISGVPNRAKLVIYNGTGGAATVSKIVGYFG